jgi:hypothetical protein
MTEAGQVKGMEDRLAKGGVSYMTFMQIIKTDGLPHTLSEATREVLKIEKLR